MIPFLSPDTKTDPSGENESAITQYLCFYNLCIGVYVYISQILTEQSPLPDASKLL